jgi:hypothetical protein
VGAGFSRPELKVNGRPADLKLDKGYVRLARTWQPGDVIELTLPMPVRRIVANEKVEADRGRVALQRGPIVYAAEWPDNPGGRVRNLMLPDQSALASEFRPDLLNGVQVVKSKAIGLAYDAQGKVVKTEQDFMAIPYAMWANRGRGQMIVWIPRTEAAAKPAPWPTVATTSTVLLRLVAHQGHDRVGRDGLRERLARTASRRTCTAVSPSRW